MHRLDRRFSIALFFPLLMGSLCGSPPNGTEDSPFDSRRTPPTGEGSYEAECPALGSAPRELKVALKSGQCFALPCGRAEPGADPTDPLRPAEAGGFQPFTQESWRFSDGADQDRVLGLYGITPPTPSLVDEADLSFIDDHDGATQGLFTGLQERDRLVVAGGHFTQRPLTICVSNAATGVSHLTGSLAIKTDAPVFFRPNPSEQKLSLERSAGLPGGECLTSKPGEGFMTTGGLFPVEPSLPGFGGWCNYPGCACRSAENDASGAVAPCSGACGEDTFRGLPMADSTTPDYAAFLPELGDTTVGHLPEIAYAYKIEVCINGLFGAGGCEAPPDPTPVCGNEQVEMGEDCDDGAGNTDSCAYGTTCSDVCNTSCKRVTLTGPSCGDGAIEAGLETCDDGPGNSDACSTYGGSCAVCSTQCQPMTVPGPYCGDEVTQAPQEQCDEGAAGGPTCLPDCTMRPNNFSLNSIEVTPTLNPLRYQLTDGMPWGVVVSGSEAMASITAEMRPCSGAPADCTATAVMAGQMSGAVRFDAQPTPSVSGDPIQVSVVADASNGAVSVPIIFAAGFEPRVFQADTGLTVSCSRNGSTGALSLQVAVTGPLPGGSTLTGIDANAQGQSLLVHEWDAGSGWKQIDESQSFAGDPSWVAASPVNAALDSEHLVTFSSPLSAGGRTQASLFIPRGDSDECPFQ